MPGTGRGRILNLLAALPITVRVLGNWENSLWRGLHRKLDLTKLVIATSYVNVSIY